MTINGTFMSIAIYFEINFKAFWRKLILVLQFLTSCGASVPGPSFRISIEHVIIGLPYVKFLKLPPVYWSTLWKSSFER